MERTVRSKRELPAYYRRHRQDREASLGRTRHTQRLALEEQPQRMPGRKFAIQATVSVILFGAIFAVNAAGGDLAAWTKNEATYIVSHTVDITAVYKKASDLLMNQGWAGQTPQPTASPAEGTKTTDADTVPVMGPVPTQVPQETQVPASADSTAPPGVDDPRDAMRPGEGL